MGLAKSPVRRWVEVYGTTCQQVTKENFLTHPIQTQKDPLADAGGADKLAGIPTR